MPTCDFCNKTYSDLPFHCRRCGNNHCPECRLPENHSCYGLVRGNIFWNLPHQESTVLSKHRLEHTRVHHKIRHRQKPIVQPHYEITKPQYETLVGQKKPKHKKLPFKLMMLIIVFTGVIAIIGYFTLATEAIVLSTNISKTKIIIEDQVLLNKIVFGEYLDKIYEYDKKNVTLKGRLKQFIRGTDQAGVYVQSIVDDNNKEIEFTKFDQAFLNKFPKTDVTENVYEVTGTFRRNYQSLAIEAVSIIESKRDAAGTIKVNKTVQYTEVESRTIRHPKYLVVRNFVFNLLGKPVICEDGTELNKCTAEAPYFCSLNGITENPKVCGCPEGQRMHESKCIPVITCSDGTLAPECSINKPKQCVDGILIDKATICGCPAGDYRRNGETCQEILRCNDGTEYDQCSKDKPLFCRNRNLIERASVCGCDWGFVAKENTCLERNIAEAKEALDYVNELRQQNGRSVLKWNDNLYQLGLFRAKDMYDRKYFDHVTPEGTCVKDFKAGYGLQSYDIAENSGAVTWSNVDSGPVDYASYANPTKQVNNWMTSRGHRYNLLYPTHEIGIVACYKGACVFLGGNRDGFGSGPCNTGTEGLAFWGTASKQPGEK